MTLSRGAGCVNIALEDEDVRVVASVALLLAAVIPILRATRIEPTEALRTE